MHVGDYLGRRATYTPDALALIDTGPSPPARLSFRALDARARALAVWLRDRGVGKGDRVALLAHDGSCHLESFGACGKLGAIHVPLNWRLHVEELAQMLERVRPRVVVYGHALRAAAEALRDREHGVEHWLVVEGAGPSLEAVVSEPTSDDPSCPDLDPEDIAALIFTGGTTGAPKGAMVSHRMVAWNALDTAIHDLREGDVYLDVFPLFHTGGLLVYTVPQLILGGTTILMPRFCPERALELIERERVTVFAAVPTMYQRMVKAQAWAGADLSCLRYCSSGGAPLPPALIETFWAQKRVRFKQGFGMSEFGPGAFSLPPEDATRKAGSIGRPEYYVEASIRDEAGVALEVGATGELWLRGPVACSGYFEPDADPTPVLDPQGWFHTGDLAHVDDEGYYYVVGRKKDMYISGGENVYPVEVERVLDAHPAVDTCAVIGVPDPEWGQVGLACVVLRPGMQVGADALVEHARAHLAGYKVPRRVEFLDALPLSGPGKVLKRELRDRFVD